MTKNKSQKTKSKSQRGNLPVGLPAEVGSQVTKGKFQIAKNKKQTKPKVQVQKIQTCLGQRVLSQKTIE